MNTIKPAAFTRLGTFKNTQEFKEYINRLGVELDCDEAIQTASESPLAQSFEIQGKKVGNRWAIHPMEGWDGTTDGHPGEMTVRRWKNFGKSGAKMIWGGEAMAVIEQGRANPNQLIIDQAHLSSIEKLRNDLVDAHQELYGKTDDLLIGFQLTHSGRFSRPYDKKKLESRIAYRHPILDSKFGITSDAAILSDDEVEKLILAYIEAAKIASKAGADFVDIKHCHGYLLHEFLGAFTRQGKFGGSFENRTRIVREIVSGIRAACPSLLIGVRLSAFDFVPYRKASAVEKVGVPEEYAQCLPYRFGFGIKQDNPIEFDLTETLEFIRLLQSLDVRLINLSAGSPYYNPHIQRPAMFPPSDGYAPPEDPLVGVARQINVVGTLKKDFPAMIFVGSGYSYLQDFLPQVAQATVRAGKVDVIGIGRSVLSYPQMVDDVLKKGTLAKRFICRTFSDCTTAPRNGLISGCYPLDDFYKVRPEATSLKEIKKANP